MNQKRCVIAFAVIMAVGLVTATGFSVQSSDPFGPGGASDNNDPPGAQKISAERSSVEYTTTSVPATRRVGPAHEQVLNFQTEQKLTSTMVTENFNFPDVPFSEVIGAMHDSYGLDVLLDESAQDDELQEDTIVSIKLQAVSLEHVLEILLGKHNATFIIRAGLVRVISKDVEDDREFFETRIFDIAELAKALPPKLSEYVPARKKEEGQTEPIDTLTTLEKLIRENIHSDSWMITGTGDAILHEINGKLMVNNSGSALRDTRRFLEYLNAEFVVKE